MLRGQIPKMCKLLNAALCAALCLLPGLSYGVDSETEIVLKVLLRPAGWSAEWSGPGGSGLTDVFFEQRSDGIFAKIKLIVPFEVACESPVTVNPTSVTFDGCRDPSVTLVYDPSDKVFPLRGRSPRGYEWKVRPR